MNASSISTGHLVCRERRGSDYVVCSGEIVLPDSTCVVCFQIFERIGQGIRNATVPDGYVFVWGEVKL